MDFIPSSVISKYAKVVVVGDIRYEDDVGAFLGVRLGGSGCKGRAISDLLANVLRAGIFLPKLSVTPT